MTYDELKRKYHDEGLDEYLDIRFDVKWGPEYVTTICREPDHTFTVIEFGERENREIHSGMTEEEACEQAYAKALATKRFEIAYREKTRRQAAEPEENARNRP